MVTAVKPACATVPTVTLLRLRVCHVTNHRTRNAHLSSLTSTCSRLIDLLLRPAVAQLFVHRANALVFPAARCSVLLNSLVWFWIALTQIKGNHFCWCGVVLCTCDRASGNECHETVRSQGVPSLTNHLAKHPSAILPTVSASNGALFFMERMFVHFSLHPNPFTGKPFLLEGCASRRKLCTVRHGLPR